MSQYQWRILRIALFKLMIIDKYVFRVSNATISVANVENAHHSTRLLAQTTLRKANS